jgi:hypothetical protein
MVDLAMVQAKLQIKIILKNSVRTAKKTQHFTITKINGFMPCKEIPVNSENHTKHIQNEELLIVEAAGTYSYHWALQGKTIQ